MNTSIQETSRLKIIENGSFIKLGIIYIIFDVLIDYLTLLNPQSDVLSLFGILFNIESTDPILLPFSGLSSAIWLTLKILIVAEAINFSLHYFLSIHGKRKIVLMVALICQFIFLASDGLNLLINYFFELGYLKSYNLLSLCGLFGYSEMSPEWLYILSSINIFLLAYIYVFSNLICNYLQVSDFNKIFSVIGGTYLIIYSIKVIVNVLFISILPN